MKRVVIDGFLPILLCLRHDGMLHLKLQNYCNYRTCRPCFMYFRFLIFDFKPFDWLCTLTQLGEYESQNRTGRLHAHCKLCQSPCACNLVQTVWFTCINLSHTQQHVLTSDSRASSTLSVRESVVCIVVL